MSPSTKKLKWVSRVIIITVVLAAACFVLLRSHDPELPSGAGNGANDTFAATDARVAPVKVEAEPAEMGDLVLRISATGLTRPLREITVVARMAGQIVQRPIEEGKFVHQGDLLLQLDDREYRLALKEARDRLLSTQVDFIMLQREEKRGEGEGQRLSTAPTEDSERENVAGPDRLDELEKAKEAFEAAQKQFQRGAISESELERLRLNYETALVLSGQKRDALLAHKTGLTEAQIAVERAELNLAQTEMRAPFSGYVADLQVEQEQYLSAGQECFKLVDLSQIEVNLQVLESEIGLVHKGRQAEVTFPAYPGETFAGQVVRINPRVDAETRTTAVTVRLANPDRRILPGMFAYAKLEAQIFKDRFLVPKDAILIRDQRKLVFVIRDGLAKWCYVETGLENEKFVEILDSSFGLKPGEMVITSGHYTLAHDARVKYD